MSIAMSEAARHLCQEARVVLCSLRGGPPAVARGELAHDLQDLRVLVRASAHIVTGTGTVTGTVTGAEVALHTSTEDMDTPVAVDDVCIDVGPFARPFLAVVMDPRAAGPHTLCALRALHRLLEQNSFKGFGVQLEGILRGVLQCKFEQTDAGADEAVELAICDLLALLVTLDSYEPELLVDAFTTVFVTRNALVHSPALLLHIEQVLMHLCQAVFQRKDKASKLMLEFLVNQLKDESDATRVTCLKLARCSLTIDWTQHDISNDNELLKVIKDDLCLSLLMTGQSIWAQAPGYVSMEVLSEICATFSAIWHVPLLRTFLVAQLETIFTGFYQRALVLLRKRPHPTDSTQFNENLVFDAELEIILESLVDLLCLDGNCLDGNSTLETLFSTYDCNLSRVDVTEHLIVELTRCCGASVSEEGMLSFEIVEHRPVPPHLKELCAEAILGYLKTLFRAPNYNSIMMDESDNTLPLPLELDDAELGDDARSVTPTPSEKLSHRTIKSRKRQFRKAAKLFNEKSSKGIDFLVKNELIQETAADVASFLRNGLVLGLDKAEVGQYLGELGKAASPGKNRPCWERDWFHKEVLEQFCSLFHFDGQPLIDGLRMFLASFRLPGESQQIDRIIQSFADSCGRRCDEAIKMNIFSEDPKRASDTAFLLAFSIIMLNTDRHNTRIREDKKMNKDAFVRNNSDYGRDITEKGKELPREFLESIYDNINEEEIRTEAEGAEGNMTPERWKDVLHGSTVSLSTQVAESDPVDLKELVVESVWMPVVSAIGACWAVVRSQPHLMMEVNEQIHSGMLSAQGARLGMDIALEVLAGVRNVGRIDIFQRIFSSICGYSGLLGEYKSDAVERTSVFVNSVEAQSAVIVCVRVAQDASNDLGMDGWMRLWSMIFELRDLKMLGGGTTSQGRNFLTESDTDLLNPASRREWKLKLAKGDFDDGFDGDQAETPRGFLGAMGRAFFGVEDTPDRNAPETPRVEKAYSIHGKDELILWDEFASSDDEEDEEVNMYEEEVSVKDKPVISRFSSPGATFESQLIHEDMLIQHRTDMPVTGLERVEDTRPYQISPRARVRKRLARACDFAGLISESRFMELGGTVVLLKALAKLIDLATKQGKDNQDQENEIGLSTEFSSFIMSPASEALAEVLLCEIAIRNKDRLGALWSSVLERHYSERLQALMVTQDEEHAIAFIEPGTEKCVTGLLRLCACAAQKEDLANEVITSLSLLPTDKTPREIEELDKHISEGIWRICSSVDGLFLLDANGWHRLLATIEWCAARAGKSAVSSGLAEDDPGLQAYRSLHLILNAPELRDLVPDSLADVIATLVARTTDVGCTKLCLASLDLLHVFQSRLESQICASFNESSVVDDALVTKWMHALDAISKAAWGSRDSVSSSVR